MKDRDKRELETKIKEELASLTREVRRLEEATRPIPPDKAIGRLTRMEAIQSKSISEANLRTATSRIARLEKALEKLDDPDFGICSRCERPIPVARMMLVPESTRCVRCMNR